MLPVLHRKHLEYGDEGHREGLVIGSRQFFVWPKVIVTLEDLSTEQSVNEDEDKHEDGDQDEVNEGL